MKRITLAIALLLVSVLSFAQSGKDIYRKYSDSKGVSAVYISPAMFRLIGKIPDLNVGDKGVNLAPLIQSLTGLYVIDSENGNVNSSLKADAEKFVKNGRYELLMEAKDDGEMVRMYTVGTQEIVNGFAMISDDGDETSFIYLDGKMKRDDLEKLLAQAMKEK